MQSVAAKLCCNGYGQFGPSHRDDVAMKLFENILVAIDVMATVVTLPRLPGAKCDRGIIVSLIRPN